MLLSDEIYRESDEPNATVVSVYLQAENEKYFVDITRIQEPKAFIDVLSEACRKFGFKPHALFMENKEIFAILIALIGDLITLQFQASPCAEELYYASLEDKVKCVVCQCTTTPKGKKLSRCFKCQNVYYCSVEHQKKDWVHHKRICK